MSDPLLEPAAVERFLDAHGLGAGPLQAARIGDGHSNVTYLVEREGARVVLRRPPPPPLPPSAHDMLREARVQRALGAAGARVPRVLAVCDDPAPLGAPFYVMEHIAGAPLGETTPAALDSAEQRRRIGEEIVDALAEIHAVDWVAAGLEGFGRPSGYLERQLRRFGALWPINATRELPQVAEIGAWLAAHVPESGPATIVHGDYRPGNLLLGPVAPARVAAVLDWELSTIGDPLADLGYLTATWSEAGGAGAASPLELSPATAAPGYLTREQLIARYAATTGRAVDALRWYEALALWKAAIFCEALYGRYLRGEQAGPWFAGLERGVPRLLADAAARTTG